MFGFLLHISENDVLLYLVIRYQNAAGVDRFHQKPAFAVHLLYFLKIAVVLKPFEKFTIVRPHERKKEGIESYKEAPRVGQTAK